MARLQRTFRLLEREYGQWFSGALPRPPSDTQRTCEDIVRRYSNSPPRNLAEQSLFSMLQARFNTYMEMWNRRTRLKEEGRLPGQKESTRKPVLSRPPPEPTAPGDPFRSVFESFVAAKQEAGEATTKLNYEAFRKTLEKQADQLRSARGFKDVDFAVAVKDGKVSVVARPKK
ncbi:MAG: MXAN_5187 C-terminal domain-containing protein [Vicinamibacteria bacterium]